MNNYQQQSIHKTEGASDAGPSCNLCGSFEFKPFVERWGLRVVRCENCGLAFTHPRPEEIASQYDEDYFGLYARRSKFRHRRMAGRLQNIETLVPPGRVLDIGCSLGYFLEVAAQFGWEPHGIDISKYAADFCTKSGFNVKAGTLEDTDFADDYFDCVTMWDTLEHVTDPTDHMHEVRRILRPGGLVVIGTPDVAHPAFRIKKSEWRHLKPAEHLYYFSRSTINRLLEKTGFKPVQPSLRNASGLSQVSAVLRQLAGRTVRLNDVLIAYGEKLS
ncbi:MAG: class I SAM-dependent methyltransferase [Lentisphaerae bacterium]|nr:class I SAM-dependent methyltransferase [Lentisphaerota bacterium]